MSTKHDFLDRIAPLVPRPERPLEDFHRLRERRRRNERIRAGTVALGLILAGTLVAANVIRSEDRTGYPPSPITGDSVQRRDGEVLMKVGDLAAVRPRTGQARILLDRRFPDRIGNAAWSADGRWLAFDIRGCTPDVSNAGLWISQALGAERLLIERPCGTVPPDALWAWSPTTSRIAVERGSPEGDSLVLIDPASGDEVDLGPIEGDLSSLAWSPDGTRIAYFADGALSYIRVEDRNTTRLAVDLGDVYGIGDAGIDWSPDGAHIAIPVNQPAPAGPVRLYTIDVDGINLHAIADDVQDFEWSPDGTRIAYATFGGPRRERVLGLWTIGPDVREASLIREEPSYTIFETASLAWSPDGTRIAYTTVTADEAIVHRVTDADGTGDARPIEELVQLSWGDGRYFCACYG